MLSLKKSLGFLSFCIILSCASYAQDTTKTSTSDPAPQVQPTVVKTDSVKSITPSAVIKSDSVKIASDTLKKSSPDSLKLVTDTLKTLKADSLNKIAGDSLKTIKPDSVKIAVKTDTVKTAPIVPIAAVAFAPPADNNKISLKTGWAVSLKAGTLGLGGEVVKELGKMFSVRLGMNYLTYQRNITIADANMDINLKLLTYTLIGDWYFVRFMHLSGGIAYNLNSIRLITSPGTSIKFGSYELTSEDKGNLTTKIVSNKFTPYIGIGFGRPISRNGRISFNTDMGILYMGGPKVEEFSATGLIEPTGDEENRKQIESNLKGYSIHPVLSFQLSYKFIK